VTFCFGRAAAGSNRRISHGLIRALNHADIAAQLFLGNNRIGNEGARALAEALAANSTLQLLWLRNNLIGVAGATALARALIVNHTLAKVAVGFSRPMLG